MLTANTFATACFKVLTLNFTFQYRYQIIHFLLKGYYMNMLTLQKDIFKNNVQNIFVKKHNIKEQRP